MDERKKSFNKGAEVYDRTRPSYSDFVINWILDRAEVSLNDTLLEIGPGTGQATIPFARKGHKVHCVELGDELANILREKCSDYSVEVDVSPFEEWIPKKGFRTPLIYSATAFHWIDKNIKYKKCFDLLSKDGNLVLMWNNPIDPCIKEIEESYEVLFSYHPDKNFQNQNFEELKVQRQSEIDSSGFFRTVDFLDYRWNQIESRTIFLDSFFSQSSFLSLSSQNQKKVKEKVTDLYIHLDREITTEFSTTVYFCEAIREMK